MSLTLSLSAFSFTRVCRFLRVIAGALLHLLPLGPRPLPLSFAGFCRALVFSGPIARHRQLFP